ncbi:MAG: hypothetical protein N2235_03835 [Fischerella sp.]|nr:hypothetical protein [Fischerella sp.]
MGAAGGNLALPSETFKPYLLAASTKLKIVKTYFYGQMLGRSQSGKLSHVSIH